MKWTKSVKRRKRNSLKFFPFLFVKVSWIRSRDLHIMTIGILTYTQDQRYQAIHTEGSDEWSLRVTSPQPRDSGVYEVFYCVMLVLMASRKKTFDGYLRPILASFCLITTCHHRDALRYQKKSNTHLFFSSPAYSVKFPRSQKSARRTD